jgi:hypothetical protein
MPNLRDDHLHPVGHLHLVYPSRSASVEKNALVLFYSLLHILIDFGMEKDKKNIKKF